MAHGDFPDRRDMRMGGNLERANIGRPNTSVEWFGRDVPGVDQRYENYRAPYRAEYASNNPHHPSHANRTDYMAQGYNSRGELQNYPSRRNMRGKDSYRINVGPRPERDTTGLGGLINRLDTGNVGYGIMLNRIFGMPFNQELLDWHDKFGDDYWAGSGTAKSQSGISSERQPGLEGGMGEGIGGLQETAGLWQDWKRIFERTGNADLADYWIESQQAV